MAKAKSGKARQKARKAAPSKPASQPRTRREQLSLWATYALGALVLGGGTWWATTLVQSDLHEQDLTRLGDGVPAIVQVHDSNCAPCIDLQRETRAALEDFDAGEITYLVASLGTTPGQVFASQHGASYATLLFFDRDGGLVNRLRGPSNREALRELFRRHIAAN